jgi:putative protein-disulfide isomerase
MAKSMTTVHYIMDPQCGWCYAAAPLLDALESIADLPIKLHGGGLFAGARKGPVSTEFRQYMRATDHKIMALTGQVFSERYTSQLLADPARIVDSETPTSALLAVASLGINPIDMLHLMQISQFVDGYPMSDLPVLAKLAGSLGATRPKFLQAFAIFQGEKTSQHFATSQQLLAVVGGHGFPTFALELADGSFSKLDHAAFYQQPAAWRQYVGQQIEAARVV